MSKSKRQSLIILAVALIMIGLILAVFSLSQPKIYVDSDGDSVSKTQHIAENSDNQPSSEIDVSLPLNINTCTYEELLAIDDIGAARASAILEYRDIIGSFTSVDQIKDIEGIGDSIYEKISPYLYV